MIVVAGGTGTLGTRLVPCLAGAGLTVRVLTRARPGHSTWAPAWTCPAVMSGTRPASAGHCAVRVR